ncbi:hypothetical protein GCM10028791_41060 [Echinicola sediminis]
MEITGRLTADATVHQLEDERKVVNFTIAINDRFKTQAGEVKDVATFIRCAYWISSKVAEWLNKGAIVQLYGRIGVDAYVNGNGKALGNLTFHTNNIKLVASANKKNGQQQNGKSELEVTVEETEDLPF